MAVLYDANGVKLSVDLSGGGAGPGSIVVMSFNPQRWEGLNSDITLMRKIIDTYKPDIIGLQEYREKIAGSDVYSAVFADYPYHYYASAIYNPVGIVSKYPLSSVSTVLYASQGSEKRGYTKAYITVNQQKICWLNTHLEILPTTEDSREIRTAQARELIGVMKAERYAICTGDFNAGDCHDKTDPDYIEVIKPFLQEGYHSANSSDQHGFLATFYDGITVNNFTRYACIDEVITTSNIDITAVDVDKQKSTANKNGLFLDHLPIVAHCRING